MTYTVMGGPNNSSYGKGVPCVHADMHGSLSGYGIGEVLSGRVPYADTAWVWPE